MAAALLAVLVSAAPAAASHVYRSPGYKGTRKLPHTLPPALPPPTQLGVGEKPQVLVDAAGTAHIIWNESRGDDADAIHYCRMKRGATQCDVNQLLVPDGPTGPGADPRYNSEYGTPRIFAVGNQVAIITHRFPNPFLTPDGSASDRSTFLFVSNDGGEHFDPGVLAGTNEDTGEATVFGPPETRRIGLISDTETAGTMFQEITGAKYQTRSANLGDEGVSVSLAPIGASVVAAFNDLNDQIHVRQWNAQGDIHDPANWSETTLQGDDPRLAGGPAGTFLMSRPIAGSKDRSYNVRSVAASGTTFGPPKVLTGTANASLRDIFEDDSGRLLSTYRVNDTVPELMQTSSTDGKTWSKPQVLRKVSGDTDIARSDIAAAADGGGFTVDQESPNFSEGPIVAVPFGNQGPTGQPGLGNQPGGAAPPDVVDKCARVEFAAVDIQLPEGCLLGVQGQPNVKIAEGTFKLNGLEIVPDAGSKILLNARDHTINTVGKVSVELRAPGISPIVLYHNELHIALGAEAKDAKNDGSVAGCSGQKLAGFDGGADLLGFPIAGSIDVYLSQDAACIPVSLALPAAFGGIRGAAVLKATNADGLVVDSLEIDVDQAYVGPVLISGLKISYMRQNDEWRGEGTIGIPPQPGGLSIKGKVRFQGGDFKEGSIDIKPPYPGIPLGPWPAYLSHIGGGFGVDPPFVAAEVGVGIIQAPPAGYVFGIEGQFKISFKDPVTFELHGQGAIYGFQLAQVNFLLNTDGFVRLNGGFGFDLGLVSLHANVDMFIDVPSGSFSAGADADGCVVDLCVGVKVVLSSKGLGACAHTDDILVPDIGAGYVWGDSVPDIMIGSCDLSAYEVPLPPGAPPRVHAAQAGAQTFQVAKGTKIVNVRLDGAEGKAPQVALISPTGERIEPATDIKTPNARAYAAYPTNSDRSFVGIMSPAPGTWQVVPLDGSPPITQLAQARDAAAPAVAGSVGGKGRKRLLSYRASTGQGLATTFYEQGPMGARKLGVAKGKRGTIKFAPAAGPRGKRTIEAVVERGGVPRLRKAIATYTAPAPARPGRVRKLIVKRRGRTVLASWRKAAAASVYAVRIDLPDGRRVLRVTRSRKVTFRGAPRDGRVTVTVAARNRSGRAGLAAKARR